VQRQPDPLQPDDQHELHAASRRGRQDVGHVAHREPADLEQVHREHRVAPPVLDDHEDNEQRNATDQPRGHPGVGPPGRVVARQGRLLRTAYLLTGDVHAAEDLVQTALAKLYLAWDRESDAPSVDAYARTIMVTAPTSMWRGLGRGRETVTDTSAHDVPVSSPEYDGVGAALWEAVRALPERQRAVAVLRYYEQLSERETAEALGVTVGTVKSQEPHDHPEQVAHVAGLERVEVDSSEDGGQRDQHDRGVDRRQQHAQRRVGQRHSAVVWMVGVESAGPPGTVGLSGCHSRQGTCPELGGCGGVPQGGTPDRPGKLALVSGRNS
jgi:RNA polymerase sigma-70 factor (sigma-E family)